VKQVFVAQHPVEAHFVKGLLQAQDIEAEVRGEALFSVRGEAPVTRETLPSVWILDDSELERALAVIAGYEHGEGPAETGGQAWRCPKCGEQLEPQFTTCWKCGAAPLVSH
jgi:hypothetical protein